VAVIGQNASVDSEEEDIEEMEHEDGAKIVGEEVSQRFRAERLVSGEIEHDDIEVDETLAAAEDCECDEIEAYATSEHWEEPAPYANKAEGRVGSVKSEGEGSEKFEVVVDAAVEHEAMSGMVQVAIANMKTELDSLLRRVQGVEVCTHTSMTKFDRRLQEIEVLHSASWTRTLNSIFLNPVISSDDADAAMIQPSVEMDIDRKDGVGGEKASSGNATTVEHADGADRRALQQSGPSGMTDGASRSMGRGGVKKKVDGKKVDISTVEER
jgi:hypothetical protein